MADTVLDYNAAINNDSDLSDGVEEEEYDAKNDETFGELEDSSKEDWEQQHEHFAEIEELTKLSDSFDSIKLDPPGLFNGSVWSYKEQKSDTNKHNALPKPHHSPQTQPMPRKMCTVEELERNLLTNKPKQPVPFPPCPAIGPPRFPGMFQAQMPSRVPPGLPLPPVPPMRPMPHLGPYNVPPGVMRMMPPPHFMPGGPPHPPGFMFPGNSQYPVGYPYNFPPPPPRNMVGGPPMNKNVPNQHNQTRLRFEPTSNGFRHRNNPDDRDEYAGLMTNREKQWLLNIQLLQLNTGTPYFDDYYYTVFKSRRANKKPPERTNHYNNNNNRHRNNSQQQENQLTPKVYTPLQFENSLGKLQCGSVTAPRKIIDMDVVAPEKEAGEAQQQTVARDTRRSKQVLLELEALYSLFLKAVDLKNPLAIGDLEKLRALKQKQRLRELEAAPTAEQKQEVLELLRKESAPVVEDQNELLARIVNALLREEKFASFFRFSKGKMLVMRLMPHLSTDLFASQLRDLWTKVLLSIPVVGRRDSAGDNVLPKFYPSFKRHSELFEMPELLELVQSLSEVVRQENKNNRGTPCPINHQGKSPLHFIIYNKFGISALCALVVRSERLISENRATDSQRLEWSAFMSTFADVSQNVVNASTTDRSSERAPLAPIEPIPRDVFARHVARLMNFGADRRTLLECMLVDTNPLLNVYFS